MLLRGGSLWLPSYQHVPSWLADRPDQELTEPFAVSDKVEKLLPLGQGAQKKEMTEKRVSEAENSALLRAQWLERAILVQVTSCCDKILSN